MVLFPGMESAADTPKTTNPEAGAYSTKNVPRAAVPSKPAKPSPQQLLARPDKIPDLLARGKITNSDIPNPHWKTDTCTTCHKTRSGAGFKNLRDRNVDRLCNTCHETLSAQNYPHASNVKVPKAMSKRMPKAFLASMVRGGNKMTCITCHDLPMTCKKKRHKEKGLNPMFFRDGPYEYRTDLCYKCHDETKYQRVNAHDQISDSGQVNEQKCMLCHADISVLKEAKSIDEVDFNIKDNLSALCWGCHPWNPHPGGPFTFFSGKGGRTNHLVKPPEYIRERMHEMEQKDNIFLPLEPGTGKVFCGTCHNPHEKGVIKQGPAAEGADSKGRLRMKNICVNCHDKG